ncbi:MAG: phosphoribosylglycinamide synthetase [Gammaproteobacteria bacterium]|nr:phosphoribosylglycinamide synthetase [Gammaproteobacteria bacterium]MCY4211828.1 phosphoribosylglycinamide synthetase [Gammaproteobacteria bacterium]MCY4281318.1 phosphoribosylglycinamide synthetase [Gammaproteobacteria bacterium]MCY4339615.1 phosphoribosylglycinamide synthetase [Gammaproteobacteria bacterium]
MNKGTGTSSLHPRCLQISQVHKDTLHFLFLAKHALGSGLPDAEDGNHAVYHYDILQKLRGIGLRVTPANTFEALYGKPDFDFLITLFNRAGFRNSEMFAPLFGEYHRIPYLGGSPIVRGVSDDKHVTKRIVQALGIATLPWKYYPMGGLDNAAPEFGPDFHDHAFIVKPNASSGSWGVRQLACRNEAARHIAELHGQGHDVIVEPCIDGADFAVPVIGARKPWMLPIIQYQYAQGNMRTYEQKRGLLHEHTPTECVTLNDARLEQRFHPPCRQIIAEFWPFDHARIEFRVDKRTGQAYFIEINLNCNLAADKAIAVSAASLGVSHEQLIETVICNSLLRQGVISEVATIAA